MNTKVTICCLVICILLVIPFQKEDISIEHSTSEEKAETNNHQRDNRQARPTVEVNAPFPSEYTMADAGGVINVKGTVYYNSTVPLSQCQVSLKIVVTGDPDAMGSVDPPIIYFSGVGNQEEEISLTIITSVFPENGTYIDWELGETYDFPTGETQDIDEEKGSILIIVPEGLYQREDDDNSDDDTSNSGNNSSNENSNYVVIAIVAIVVLLIIIALVILIKRRRKT